MYKSSVKQVLARKSIDKLVTESESAGHRLKKSLGPWSLTALGIGAIIGSGIFVLTGTAAAGEHFEAPSLLHAQVLDLLINFFQPQIPLQSLPSDWSLLHAQRRVAVRETGIIEVAVFAQTLDYGLNDSFGRSPSFE